MDFWQVLTAMVTGGLLVLLGAFLGGALVAGSHKNDDKDKRVL